MPTPSHLEHLFAALGFLKDWSNYLLVTTVAAVGWAVSDKSISVDPRWRNLCIWIMTVSVVFGIFTLALIPLVAEAIDSTIFKDPDHASFYDVLGKFQLFWVFGPTFAMKLKWVCWVQHVAFMTGIFAYTFGATQGKAATSAQAN